MEKYPQTEKSINDEPAPDENTPTEVDCGAADKAELGKGADGQEGAGRVSAEERTEEQEGVTAEEEEERAGAYGDMFIEEFSAEQQARKFSSVTKIPEKIAAYIVAAIYFVVGVLCVSITEHVVVALPYIVGGAMALLGLTGFIISLVRREYRTVKTNKTATSIIATLLGIMILVEQFDPDSDPIMLISIIWGVLGLIEGAYAFNLSFKRMSEARRFAYFLLKGIVECVVAFILLYKPESEGAHFLHIVVFGISLMADAVTTIPKVKEFLTAE